MIELIERKLKNKIVQELTRIGLLFRLFSRIKTQDSIDEKIIRKSYNSESKLMQDIIGFRIITYFADDLKIIVDICQKLFENLELVYDTPSSEVFKPLHNNMICRFPKEQSEVFEAIKKDNDNYKLIDNTFEIQFRTTFSEGWYEVDHLMRYKCKTDWESLNNESRMLNGIYATLETNDQVLKILFDNISYQHYKAKKWEAMLRNKLRLRFLLIELDGDIISYLNADNDIGKKILRLDRNKILNKYIEANLFFPVTFNNWIYFINYCFIKDELITSKTIPALKNQFVLAFNS